MKIRFLLDGDSDGWPPVGSEGVWAIPLGSDRYRLDNTPWFARGVAYGDVVEARAGSDDLVWVTSLVERNDHLTIRVIPFRSGPREVLDAFRLLGVTGESAEPAFTVVALDVPPGVSLREVKDLLLAGQQDGSWEYEEGCVSEEWLAV